MDAFLSAVGVVTCCAVGVSVVLVVGWFVCKVGELFDVVKGHTTKIDDLYDKVRDLEFKGRNQ